MKIIFLLTSFAFAFRVIPEDSLITVPIDYNTIQGAINNAEDGFVIVVYPDVFNENIMIDKNITLTSLALFDTTTNSLSVSLETWFSDDYPITITNEYINNTIIDGSDEDSSAVIIHGDSCITPLIQGFTIQNGNGTLMDRKYISSDSTISIAQEFLGGGILLHTSNPIIHYNQIRNNGEFSLTEAGAAIYAISDTEDSDFLTRHRSINTNTVCENNSYDFNYNFFENNTSNNGRHLSNRLFNGEFDLSGSIFDVWNCQNPDYQTKIWINIDEIEDLTAEAYQANSCLRSEDTYVDPNSGNDDLNIGSVDSPFLTIKKALASVAGSELAPVTIRLAEGTYSPSTNGETFPINMINHVNLIGEGEDVSILDAEGSAENITQVMSLKGINNCMLEKLRVTNGYCLDQGNYTTCSGGGIDLQDSDITLKNVLINENHTDQCGGGIALHSSTLHTVDVKINNNFSVDSDTSFDYSFGGGICASESYLELVNTDISFNEATAGGGIWLFESNFNLFSVNITNNSAIGCCWAVNEGGGGINIAGDFWSDDVSFMLDSRAQYVTIAGNYSDHRGGGIAFHDGGTLKLTGVTIVDNISDRDGGGIFNSSQLIIKNSIVKNNESPYKPVNIFNYIDPNYINNIITYSNIADTSYNVGATADNDYCINIDEEYNGLCKDLDFDDCLLMVDVGCKWNGEIYHNIDEDPLFVSPESGDYSLSAESPCIDTGDPNPWYFDADSTIADMGAMGSAFLSINFDNYNFADIYETGGEVVWKINNYGDQPITIDSVIHTNDDFSSSMDDSKTIDPFEEKRLSIICNPSSIGKIEDTMRVYIQGNNHDLYVSLSAMILEGHVLEGHVDGLLPKRDNYIITDDLYVDEGHELIIEPGSQLLFDEGSRFTINGTLTAIGSETDSIIFKSHDANGKWDGITLNGYESVIEYAKISGAKGNIGNRYGLRINVKSTINNSSIFNNGRGIYLYNSNSNINNVEIYGNVSNSNGGGIFISNSNPYLTNVFINDNSASSGGGLYLNNSTPTLFNVIINGNIASQHGGGIYLQTFSELKIINATISDNSASSGGGLYLANGSTAKLINSILWSNNPQSIYFYDDHASNNIYISYSDIEGGEDSIITNNNGELQYSMSNINIDPLFLNSENGDYKLHDSSPCIDSGTAFHEDAGDTLININSDEYNGSAPDMGAFEYGLPLEIEKTLLHADYHLHFGYPNPFNPSTNLNYTLPKNGDVNIRVYDINGRYIQTLINEFQISGYHAINWNASNYPSGVYFIRMESGKFVQTQKVVLVK